MFLGAEGTKMDLTKIQLELYVCPSNKKLSLETEIP